MDKNDSHSRINHEGRPHLVIDGLRVAIGEALPVRHVSLSVARGSIHCLVGGSGSGKTMTSLAAVGLLPPGARAQGSIRLGTAERNLLTMETCRWDELRGSKIGYVGQNALGCLHPAYSVEFQLVEAIRRHQRLSRSQARTLGRQELTAAGLDASRVAAAKPSQLSGGMCQRVALAIALCNRPDVLIADEPTTALDGDTQDQILDLIRSRVERDDLGVLLITHDQSVVAGVADAVTSIANGAAERTAVSPVAPRPVRHSRTAPPPEGTPVLEITGIGKTYGRSRRSRRRAATTLRNVTISAPAGSTVGLLGRSGAGKTTLAQIVAGVLAPTEGSVRIAGRPVTGANRVGRVEKAGLVQYVFQDPFGSLNPRRQVLAQVAEPLLVMGESPEVASDRARDLLRNVGLTPRQMERHPPSLSGGQCQRVGIARALIRRPDVVVLDEPVSALDWSIRDEVLDVLGDLQDTTNATYLLIAHDRPLIERQCDRIFEVAGGTVRPL